MAGQMCHDVAPSFVQTRKYGNRTGAHHCRSLRYSFLVQQVHLVFYVIYIQTKIKAYFLYGIYLSLSLKYNIIQSNSVQTQQEKQKRERQNENVCCPQNKIHWPWGYAWVCACVQAGQMQGASQLIAESCELQMAPPAGGHFIRFDFSIRKKNHGTKQQTKKKQCQQFCVSTRYIIKCFFY